MVIKTLIVSMGLLSGTAEPIVPVYENAIEEQAQTPDSSTVVLSLEDALKIALSENIAVQVADKEIERTRYAIKGAYAALFPKIDASAIFQRTIKKQVMYMDFDMSKLMGGGGSGKTLLLSTTLERRLW